MVSNDAGADAGDFGGVPQMTPDEICIQLADAADGDLVGAIMACREQRETMTPLLLKWLRQTLDEIREEGGRFVADELPFHSLYVLAEFDAREALPLVVEALRLPGDGAFDFYGDAIDSLVARVLAAWDTEELQHVSEIMGDRSLSFEVRMSVTEAFRFRVRDGRMTRQEVIKRIREYLRECLSHGDSDGVTIAVSALCQLGPNAASEEIEEAFRQDQVQAIEFCRIMWDEARKSAETGFDKEIAILPPSRVDDAAEELIALYDLDEDDDDVPLNAGADDWLYENLEPFDPGIPAAPSVTVRNETPKVGRNDPCPCGSGKKYKKCCGKAS